MARRVLTLSSIDEMLARGCREFMLGPDDIVTMLAAERAREQGLALVRFAPPASASGAGPARAEQVERSEAGLPGDERAAVRRAVIGVLGAEPEGLDEAIDRVLGLT